VLTGQIRVAALRKILTRSPGAPTTARAERFLWWPSWAGLPPSGIARSAESICCKATRNKCYPRA